MVVNDTGMTVGALEDFSLGGIKVGVSFVAGVDSDRSGQRAILRPVSEIVAAIHLLSDRGWQSDTPSHAIRHSPAAKARCCRSCRWKPASDRPG